MASVSKEDLRELLREKYNINKPDYKIIDKIVEELYDLNRKTVIPLTELETFVFRKRYGINTIGYLYPIPEISRELKIKSDKLSYILGVCFTKLAFRINKIEKKDKIPKMSSFDIKDGEDIFISDLNLDNDIANIIMKRGIYSLRELLEYSKIELSKIFSKKMLDMIVEYIHNLGYIFIDELAIVDVQRIIAKSNEEQINNSSIYFINSVKNLDTRILNKMNALNIKDFILKISYLNKNAKAMILKDIITLNIKVKNISEYTYEELYKSSVLVLGITKDIYKNLERFGILKIENLISLEKNDINKILQNKENTKYLINKVHALGLIFKDEMEVMHIYTETLEEELNKHM